MGVFKEFIFKISAKIQCSQNAYYQRICESENLLGGRSWGTLTYRRRCSQPWQSRAILAPWKEDPFPASGPVLRRILHTTDSKIYNVFCLNLSPAVSVSVHLSSSGLITNWMKRNYRRGSRAEMDPLDQGRGRKPQPLSWETRESGSD